jgi:hypothetical protein
MPLKDCAPFVTIASAGKPFDIVAKAASDYAVAPVS